MNVTLSNKSPRRSSWSVSLGVLSIAILLAASYFLYRANPGLRHLHVENTRLELTPHKLAPRIYILGGLRPSAAYAVETDNGLVLIDSGLDNNATQLKSELSQLGLNWLELRAILITHVHGDHSGGAQYLREMTGAKIYAGENDANALRTGEPRVAFFSTFYMPKSITHPTTVDVELHGGELIDFGNVHFKVLATPGHTHGSICYLMEQRGGPQALFAGDVITKLSGSELSRNGADTPLGTYSAYLGPRYRGSASDYLNSLRQLRNMPVPDLVLPGHPAGDEPPQNATLSQDRWQRILDNGIREMEDVVARYNTDGSDFLDDVPKQLLPDLFYLGEFGGHARYCFFASSKLILVDATGGKGLLEFVRKRLNQLGLGSTKIAAILLASDEVRDEGGLREIVTKWKPQIVAPNTAIETLKKFCPNGTIFRSATDLPALSWFKGAPIPLQGLAYRECAYLLECSGKRVLFTGRIPKKLTPQTLAGFASEVARSPADSQEYLESLERIRGLRPDLWLPGTPTDDQNANLYSNEWDRLINENEKTVRFILSKTRLN